MRIALLGDTHFPRRGSILPDPCLAECRSADLIVHTGDRADMGCLAHLRSIGPPVVAISGNADNDTVKRTLALTAEVELPGGDCLGWYTMVAPRKGVLRVCVRDSPTALRLRSVIRTSHSVPLPRTAS